MAEKTSLAISDSVIDCVAWSFTFAAIFLSMIDFYFSSTKDGGPNAWWLSKS